MAWFVRARSVVQRVLMRDAALGTGIATVVALGVLVTGGFANRERITGPVAAAKTNFVPVCTPSSGTAATSPRAT